jgi:hypothetical protein
MKGGRPSVLDPYLYPGAFRYLAMRQTDDPVVYHALELFILRRSHTVWCGGAMAHSLVHSGICQPIGFLVVGAQNVVDGEPIQLIGQSLCLGMQFLQGRTLDLVRSLHLPHHQLRVAYHLQRLGAMLQRVLKRRQQPPIFGVIVGLMTEILAQGSDLTSRLIGDYDAITGGAGIAACAPINVSDEVRVGSVLAIDGEQVPGVLPALRR